MEIWPRKSHRVPLSAILPILLTSIWTGELLAQQSVSAQLISGSATINLRVIQSRKVNAGDHFITLNRVAPPVLPQPTPVVAAPLSPSMLQWIQAREKKAYKFIMLGGTIYDHQFTDLRWFDGDQWVRVFSNIDFNYFCGVGEIETADTIYDFFMMTSDEPSDYLPEGSQTLKWLAQARQQLPLDRVGYVIVEGNSVNNPDALEELDAIHAYFNANKAQIIADYQQRMATWAQQQAWSKAHPPVPHDTVINFWPVKSSLYLKGKNQ